MKDDDEVPCFLLISWNFSFKFTNFWPLKRRLLIEWNFILLKGDVDDFFGWSVFANDFAFDGDDIVDLGREEVEAAGASDDELFIKDGGVVLNCNQSR